ncbi:MAG TPA: hypothetical protein VFU22_13130 [Roseiflexaceae bacterium]|nr:hypothetical protein [Roseiflexaceae bacterium]
MRMSDLRISLATLAILLTAGCAGQNTPAPSGAPSPTIAAAAQPAPAKLTPTLGALGSRPSAAPAIQAAPAQPSAGPAAEPSIYLWPSYLPPNMRPSPNESRVASEGQTGEAGLGFYIITLNAGQQKLSIGGGDLSDVLPLSGEQRPVTAGARSGTLISSGERREIIFDIARGKLFVYSSGLSEEELLKVAGSLQPVDVKTLRELIAAP